MSNISFQNLDQIFKQKLEGQNVQKAEQLQKSLDTSDEKIEKAAQEFETMMVKMMLTQMTSSLESGGFFGKEAGADFYNDMYMDSMSKMISENQSLGLSDMIVRQLKNDYSGMAKPSRDSLQKNEKELVIDKIPIVQENTANTVSTQKAARTVSTPKVVSEPKTLMDRLTKYDDIIEKASDTYNINKNLIKAVIAQESYGNPKATSAVGAKGLMQLMDGTAKDLGVNNPYNPEENVMAGAKYLKQMKDKFGSDELALAAYNAGPGNVAKHNGIPPFKETKNYVRNVMRYFNSL